MPCFLFLLGQQGWASGADCSYVFWAAGAIMRLQQGRSLWKNSTNGWRRESAVILTHPQKHGGEAKGRSAVADLHCWRPSHTGSSLERYTKEQRWRGCRDVEKAGQLWCQKAGVFVCVEQMYLLWIKYGLASLCNLFLCTCYTASQLFFFNLQIKKKWLQ